MRENQAKVNLERDKIPKMEMNRPYIEASNESIVNKALEWNQQGRRRGGGGGGRPSITWRSTERMEAEHQGKSWLEIKSLSRNRIQWRVFINVLYLSEG
jgi:hypothetical protein